MRHDYQQQQQQQQQQNEFAADLGPGEGGDAGVKDGVDAMDDDEELPETPPDSDEGDMDI
jgi:hypothetical protein